MQQAVNDDPRKLSAMISRASELASTHSVTSAVAGLAAPEGDLGFPEYVSFLRSALRVEDRIFCMTRDRAVVHLADVDAKQAADVLDRLLASYQDEFPSSKPPAYTRRIFEVKPGTEKLRVKDVLTEIFPGSLLN